MKFTIGKTADGKLVVDQQPPSAAPQVVVNRVAAAPIMAKPLELPYSIPTMPYYNSMQSVARIQGDLEAYDEDELPNDYCYNLVFVIGCGGTGGYVVRDLARYLSTLPYASRIIMVLVDGDEVEERNLIRQNFINKDIGKNKAEVLATRYGAAYGLKMIAVPTHLTAENFSNVMGRGALEKLVDIESGLQQADEEHEIQAPTIHTNLAIISCVDNNKTRALISKTLGLDSRSGLKVFAESIWNPYTTDTEDETVVSSLVESITWIDSGNESNAGQVICYYDSLFNGNTRHRQWGWNASTLRFGDNRVAFPRIRLASSDAIYRSILDYTRNLDVESYISNFTERSREKSLEVATSMAKKFDPYAAGSATQAKFILGSVLSRNNVLCSGYFTFPITWVYPDVLDQAGDKTNLEMSCAERSVADTQTQIVNVQAASHILYYASKIFASNPKNAFLDSFGCSWSGSACVDYKLTKTNINRILDKANMSRVYRELGNGR